MSQIDFHRCVKNCVNSCFSNNSRCQSGLKVQKMDSPRGNSPEEKSIIEAQIPPNLL